MMPDYDKVIKGLECCKHGSAGCTMNCPYDMPYDCTNILMTDALELLKKQDRLLCKQQKVIDKLQADYAMLRHKFLEKTQIVRCKDCKHGYKCEDSEFILCVHPFSDGHKHTKEWYCYDGEKK